MSRVNGAVSDAGVTLPMVTASAPAKVASERMRVGDAGEAGVAVERAPGGGRRRLALREPRLEVHARDLEPALLRGAPWGRAGR